MGTESVEPILDVADLWTGYGDSNVLHGVSLSVESGEAVSVLGSNGAGKSTLLKCIIGALAPTSGEIRFLGEPATRSPESMVKQGVAITPEGRRVFANLTVRENILVGAGTRRMTADLRDDIDALLERFPVLAERRNQSAGTLSGGEQSMLAIARALVSRPKLLLMDEPSLGLAPLVIREVGELVQEIVSSMGVSVLLVEQNAPLSASVTTRSYVLQSGSIVAHGPAEQFGTADFLADFYLGAR